MRWFSMRWFSPKGRPTLGVSLAAVVTGIVLIVGTAAGAQGKEVPPEPAGTATEPITMLIMDDDAVLLITKVEGRDVVRVIGRTQIDHRTRSVWTNELEYDEEAGRAVMTGDVELTDDGDDGLHLTSDHLELNLNTEAALAIGDVRFTRQNAGGTAHELHYGEYSDVYAVIEAELSIRPEAVRHMVQDSLTGFAPDDKVLVLRGQVDMKDGEREFQSEFVIMNTRDDAMVSLGRSAATLPGPDGDAD